nr:hypothetical protein [Tanacetum cinerariifolium]
TVTSLKIQNDGYKVTNANLNRCYEELSKANTHLRTTSLEKIAAQKAEIATLNAKTVGNKTSGTTKHANPKVIAPGMYAISPKWIVPQRRTNRETPIPLPKKKQAPRFIKKPVAPLLKKPNVNVPLSTGIKSATGTSKPVSKSNAWIYRKLPAKSAKGEKVEEHIRNLNKNNRVDSHVKRSVSVKNLNTICGACHACLISFNHDNCLVYSVKSVNCPTHNLENKPYLFDLRNPLLVIQDHRGRQIIPKDYYIHNDLEYLKGEDFSRKYSTSVTKTKAPTYELKWIEDLVSQL